MEKSQCLNGDASTTPEAFNVRNLYCDFELNPPLVDNSKSYQEFPDLTSNAVLNYISQMLLEEAMDEKAINYEDEMTLQATEKSFYDILGENCPSSIVGSLLDGTQNQHSYIVSDSGKHCNGFMSRPFHAHDGPSWEHPVSSNLTSTLPLGTPSVWQFPEGVDESINFLPNIDKLLVDLELDQYRVIQKTQDVGPSTKKKESSNNPRSKKKPNDSDNDLLEGRSQKQIAVYPDAPDENVISDTVLLLFGRKSTEEVRTIRKILQKEIRGEQNEAKASERSMKQDNNHISKDSANLSSLLASCSQAVFTNDRPTAIELMKKIRECSSPTGDPFQRLAYYFINGLEARLAGTGSEIYRRLVSKQPTLTDILKAYRVYIASCPYVPSSFYLANQTIYNIAKEDAKRVHIINYGIFHGFQWPSFFEYFSDLKSTPPKIRITVIEEPEPGFRPNKRVDAIGRRLVFYAKQYNVSFEYQGIASKWENVKSEDLNIGKEEKVVVCCLVKSSMLPDETTDMCSPRDKFLKTIRKIKPHAFIHGISNALYNSPFFLGRFRLALSHYTSWFDMLDSTLPRHNPERVLIEREMFIPDAINTIACEGLDRVDRPETYKQWQARHHRAGLEQIPVDSMIINNLKNFVRECYHKNFFVDEDDRWVLMGWKGRVLYAMSIWKPNEM